MTKAFDPDRNPYVEDLIRLSLVPRKRYSREERRTLARILAGKLYELSLESPFYTDLGYGSWQRLHTTHERVEIDVIFDDDPVELQLVDIEHRYLSERPLIVLSAGKAGVLELFNGFPDYSTVEDIKRAAEAVQQGRKVDISGKAGIIERRHDAEAADNYRSVGDAGGNNGNRGNRPPGSQGGGGADDVPGSRGLRELINHPVLFSVEDGVFASILEEV